MMALIRLSVKARSELFREAGVTSLAQYENMTGETLPILVNLFDGYDAVREHAHEVVVEETLTEVTRKGAALGIYALITANRFGAIYSKVQANIKTRLAISYLKSWNRILHLALEVRRHKRSMDEVKLFMKGLLFPNHTCLKFRRWIQRKKRNCGQKSSPKHDHSKF
jgi:hypothetical protein